MQCRHYAHAPFLDRRDVAPYSAELYCPFETTKCHGKCSGVARRVGISEPADPLLGSTSSSFLGEGDGVFLRGWLIIRL